MAFEVMLLLPPLQCAVMHQRDDTLCKMQDRKTQNQVHPESTVFSLFVFSRYPQTKSVFRVFSLLRLP